MSRSLTYTNPSGGTVTFSSTSVDYLLTSIEGIDIPPLTIQEQRAPFQNGTTPIDRIAQPREIVIRGIIRISQNLASIDVKRRSIISALNPKLGPGTITYVNAVGTTYYLYDVTPEGPLFKNKSYIDPRQEFQVSFHCHDPFLYKAQVVVVPSLLTFSAGSFPATTAYYTPMYGNGKYVLTDGLNVKSSVSTDLVNWTNGVLANYPFAYGTYGNGLFVIIQSTTGATACHSAVSIDGLNWSYGTMTSYPWSAIAYGDSKFIVVSNVGGTTATSAITAVSSDGINWNYGTISKNNWYSIAYGNNVFCTKTDTKSAVSTDGLAWTYSSSPLVTSVIGPMAFGNNKFVVVPDAAVGTSTAVSTDGLIWSYGSITALTWSQLSYGNGLFITVDCNVSSTTCSISTDGITWSNITIPETTPSRWTYILYGGGAFFVKSNQLSFGEFNFASITNNGDYQTPVEIIMTTPGTNPVVTCGEEYIKLVHEFAATDIITINTEFGNKTVYSQTSASAPYVNISNYLDVNSTFWQLQRGLNKIIASNATTPTTISVGITYAERYTGI
ncbi:MAG: phage tail family protein [Candidatus Nanoarchaeia archaeon]|nr:phage tail family protein [Candidatus Nanoarchaeia archaeon]